MAARKPKATLTDNNGLVNKSKSKNQNDRILINENIHNLHDENIMPEHEMTSSHGNIATELTDLDASNGLHHGDDTDASVAAVAMAAAAAAVGYPGASVVVPQQVHHVPSPSSSSKPIANNKLLLSRRSYSRGEYSHEGKTDDDYDENGILKLCLTYDHFNNLRVKIPTRCVHCPLRSCRANFQSSKEIQMHFDAVHADELGLGPHYDVRSERRLMTAEEKRKADSVTRRRAKKSTLYTSSSHCLDLQRELHRRAFQITKTVEDFVSSNSSAELSLDGIRSRWRFLCMRKQHLAIIEFLRTTIPFYIAVQLNSAIQSEQDHKELQDLINTRANYELPVLWNDLHWTGNRVTGFRNACYAYHYLCTGQHFRSTSYYELPADNYEPSFNVTVPRILLRDIPLYSARYAKEYGTKPDVLLDAEGERSFEEFKINITNMVNANSYFKENVKILSENNWSMLPSVETVPNCATTLKGSEAIKEFLVKNNFPAEPKFLDELVNGERHPILYDEGEEGYTVAIAEAIAKASDTKHPRKIFNEESEDREDGNDDNNFYNDGELVNVDVTTAAAAAAAVAAATAAAIAASSQTTSSPSSSSSLKLELPEPTPVDSKNVDPSLQGAGEEEEDEGGKSDSVDVDSKGGIVGTTNTSSNTITTTSTTTSKINALSTSDNVDSDDADNLAFTTLLQAVEEENKRKRTEEYDNPLAKDSRARSRKRSKKPIMLKD